MKNNGTKQATGCRRWEGRCGERVEGKLVSGEKVLRGMGCGMEGEGCEWEEGTSEMCVLKHFHSYKTHAILWSFEIFLSNSNRTETVLSGKIHSRHKKSMLF